VVYRQVIGLQTPARSTGERMKLSPLSLATVRGSDDSVVISIVAKFLFACFSVCLITREPFYLAS